MPERVGEKTKANGAFPIGGEYVVDVDSMNVWQPHDHNVGSHGVCYGCLESSRRVAIPILSLIEENHSKIHVVFSIDRLAGFRCLLGFRP